MRVPEGDLAPDVLARIDADRRRADRFRVVTRTIPIVWVEDHSVRVRFIAHYSRLRDAFRRWSELEQSGHRIYLETFGGNGSGPGFGFTDIRIYLDGVIAGRCWGGGCSLGFGGGVGPAVAMLRDDLALRFGPKLENLELVRETEPGTKAGRDRTANLLRRPRGSRAKRTAAPIPRDR
jgi:hypothetical protein